MKIAEARKIANRWASTEPLMPEPGVIVAVAKLVQREAKKAHKKGYVEGIAQTR